MHEDVEWIDLILFTKYYQGLRILFNFILLRIVQMSFVPLLSVVM